MVTNEEKASLLQAAQGELFHVCDPLSSKIKLTADELEKYMDTPIGRICIAVGDDNPNDVGDEKHGYVKKD